MNVRRHYEVNYIITLDAFAVTRFNVFKIRYFTYLVVFNIKYPYHANTTIKQQHTFFILILQYGSIWYNMVRFIVW